jgi:exosortase K
MNSKAKWSAQICVVGLCALALKAHYSIASPDQLRWILSPTTWLVELLSGRSFSFESHAGYMSSDHCFLIAASCAGVNFMIASFLMLSLRVVLASRSQSISWRFLPLTAVAAYTSTIVANTVRICIALEMQKAAVHSELLDGGELHRLEGIVVYFAFLLMLFFATEQKRTRGLAARLRQFSFPLGIYYITTLLLPVMNGAYRRRVSFWEHSLFVMLVPVVLGVLVLAFYAAVEYVKEQHQTRAKTKVRSGREQAIQSTSQ